MPTIFVAVTVNVYSVSDDNSVNVDVLVDAFVVANKLSGDPVIVYPVIGLLPSELGTLQETTQSILVPVEIGVSTIVVNKLVGEEGTVGVVRVRVAGTEFPIIFTAVIVNVYNVSADNGVNVNVLVDAFVVTNKLSGDPVIVYPVIAVPPSELGVSHVIVELMTSVTAIVDEAFLGEEGTAGIITVSVRTSEFPDIFVAIILNVYVVSADNGVNVNVLVDAFVLPDKLPGDPVIVYPVIGAPPSELGVSHVIVELMTSVTVMLDEAFLGEETGKTVVTPTTAGDELPAMFVEVILNVYAVFTVNPVNV